MQQEKETKEGVVIEALPGTTFRVKLNEDDREILVTLSGRMRLNRIRVLVGDRVKVELGPYDETRGRIIYRDK
ncbi:MAG: translation initiation factor IF-1 [Candidatus Portnoybacteria bacterium]